MGYWKPCVAPGWQGLWRSEGASWDSTPSEVSTQCCRLRLTTDASTRVFSSKSLQTNSEPSGSGPQTKCSWPPRVDDAVQPLSHARLFATPWTPLPGVHEHTRLPCPSLPPRVCSNLCPLSRWCYPRVVEASNCCIKSLHTWSAKHDFLPNWNKTNNKTSNKSSTTEALKRSFIVLQQASYIHFLI